MFNLTQPQTQQASAGNAMNITSDMPEMQPCSVEKFYTIIIKTMCDYHPGSVDVSLS